MESIKETVTELVTDEFITDNDVVTSDEVANEVAETAPAQLYVKHNVFRPSFHQKKVVVNHGMPMLFENPLDGRSPQDILECYGMRRRDNSMFPNNNSLPQYGDFSDFRDFGERVQLYLSCKDQFEALPSEVRREFGDDLTKFTQYVNSSDFDVKKLMSKSFRENYYEPEQRRIAREQAYNDYLIKKQEAEMLGDNIT